MTWRTAVLATVVLGASVLLGVGAARRDQARESAITAALAARDRARTRADVLSATADVQRIRNDVLAQALAAADAARARVVLPPRPAVSVTLAPDSAARDTVRVAGVAYAVAAPVAGAVVALLARDSAHVAQHAADARVIVAARGLIAGLTAERDTLRAESLAWRRADSASVRALRIAVPPCRVLGLLACPSRATSASVGLVAGALGVLWLTRR